jgi:hypothetical protein
VRRVLRVNSPLLRGQCLERNFVIGLVYDPKGHGFVGTDLNADKADVKAVADEFAFDPSASGAAPLEYSNRLELDPGLTTIQGMIVLNIYGPPPTEPYYINKGYVAAAARCGCCCCYYYYYYYYYYCAVRRLLHTRQRGVFHLPTHVPLPLPLLTCDARQLTPPFPPSLCRRYYMPASMACTDFLYYPAAFTRLGSIKNSPVPFVLSFFACKPNPQKVLLDSLGIAQGLVGIIVELVLSVMMAVGGYWAIFRRKNKTDYEEGELRRWRKSSSTPSSPCATARRRPRRASRCRCGRTSCCRPCGTSSTSSPPPAAARGTFRFGAKRTAPRRPRPDLSRPAPRHPLTPSSPPSIPVAEKRLKELWADPQFDARV